MNDTTTKPRRRWKLWVTASMVAVLVLTGAGMSVWHYQQKRGELRDDLQRIPADAFAFATIRIADYWHSPGGNHLRDSLNRHHPQALGQMERELGLGPGNIERITLVVPKLETLEKVWYGFVVTNCRLDADKIGQAYNEKAVEGSIEGNTYYFRNGLAYHFMSYYQVMVGTEEGLRLALTTPAAQEGPLKGAIDLATAAQHHIIAGVNPPQAALKEYRDKIPQLFRAAFPAFVSDSFVEGVASKFTPALELRSATLLIHEVDGLNLQAQVHYGDEERARRAKEALEGSKALAKLSIPSVRKMIPPNFPKEIGKLLTAVGTTLDKMKLESHGPVVHVPFHVQDQSSRIGAMLAMMVPMVLGSDAAAP